MNTEAIDQPTTVPAAAGEGAEGAPEEAEPNPARQILEGILGPPPAQNPDAGADGADPAAPQSAPKSATPIEETILNEGLNRLFKKTNPEPQPAEAEAAPAEPQ